MHSPVATKGYSPRPFVLVALNREMKILWEREYASIKALAEAVHRLSPGTYNRCQGCSYNYDGAGGFSRTYTCFSCREPYKVWCFRAYSPSGKEISVEELQAWSERLRKERYSYYYYRADLKGYVRRQGPVPGMGRYGRGSVCRRMRTMNEAKNSFFLAEEGEVGPRAARRPNYLPNSWDDVWRVREKCWKSQHKGRKSWDRPKLK